MSSSEANRHVNLALFLGNEQGVGLGLLEEGHLLGLIWYIRARLFKTNDIVS